MAGYLERTHATIWPNISSPHWGAEPDMRMLRKAAQTGSSVPVIQDPTSEPSTAERQNGAPAICLPSFRICLERLRATRSSCLPARCLPLCSVPTSYEAASLGRAAEKMPSLVPAVRELTHPTERGIRISLSISCIFLKRAGFLPALAGLQEGDIASVGGVTLHHHLFLQDLSHLGHRCHSLGPQLT